MKKIKLGAFLTIKREQANYSFVYKPSFPMNGFSKFQYEKLFGSIIMSHSAIEKNPYTLSIYRDLKEEIKW